MPRGIVIDYTAGWKRTDDELIDNVKLQEEKKMDELRETMKKVKMVLGKLKAINDEINK